VLHSHPLDSDEEDALCFDRIGGTVSLSPWNAAKSAALMEATEVQAEIVSGILGIVHCLSGPAMLVLTGIETVARVQGNDVYRITSTKLVPILSEPRAVPSSEAQDEETRINGIMALMQSDFFLSYTGDLTLTQGRRYELSKAEGWLEQPLWKRTDSRFFWNKSLTKDLARIGAHGFILPVMCGSVEAAHILLQGISFELVLIGRRSRHRAGTRYRARGIGKDGNVANFVETEQLVMGRGRTSSFVIIRGSAPIFWEQNASIAEHKPKIIVESNLVNKHGVALSLHMRSLKHLYGDVVVVSLLEASKDSAEHDLHRNFLKTLAESHGGYRAVPSGGFDFHAETARMHYEHLGKLVSQLEDVIVPFGFHALDNNPPKSAGASHGPLVSLLQKGVLRVNCVDCLDRTNVVQSLVAHRVLFDQLEFCGLELHDVALAEISSWYLVTPPNWVCSMEVLFKEMWAAHGDVISNQYAGTEALKRDFLRKGKRTLQGLLSDGVNSMRRYVQQNFRDQDRQNAINFFLGETDSTEVGLASPSVRRERWQDHQLLHVRLCASCVLPKGEDLMAGWCMAVVDERRRTIQERVIVLTSKALYLIKFDHASAQVLTASDGKLAVDRIELGCVARLESCFFDSDHGMRHAGEAVWKRGDLPKDTPLPTNLLPSLAITVVGIKTFRTDMFDEGTLLLFPHIAEFELRELDRLEVLVEILVYLPGQTRQTNAPGAVDIVDELDFPGRLHALHEDEKFDHDAVMEVPYTEDEDFESPVELADSGPPA
jgi:hypothetical protein